MVKDKEKIWAILLAGILEKNKFYSTHVRWKNVLCSMNSEEVKLLQVMKYILVSKESIVYFPSVVTLKSGHMPDTYEV